MKDGKWALELGARASRGIHVSLTILWLAMAVFLTGGSFAAETTAYGDVSVVSEQVIWNEEGKTVQHTHFAPDSSRIVFVVKDVKGIQILSIKPDGTGGNTLWAAEGVMCTRLAISRDAKKVGAIIAQEERRYALAGDIGGRLSKIEGSDGVRTVLAMPDRVIAVLDDTVPGGPYKSVALSPGGTMFVGTKDLPSPVGVVRGAGLWVWDVPTSLRESQGISPAMAHSDPIKPRQILSPDEWLVGVAYYEYMITFAPAGDTIRFIGARLKPFSGLKHRPLCVWEVPTSGGDPKRLGTFGWWPRYWRGDPARHGASGYNVGTDAGLYMAEFYTGKVYKFDKKVFGRGTRASYSHDCSMAALPGKELKLLRLEKKEL